ncbi:hypothetical protein FIH29_06085 [Salmonella enterica subsp. enterica]|nr:hypothetical protein [Salmonella enterica subsp. enterica serovar Newport]EBS3987011.1 hypothetical protein [Salmonella enterica subsp. enterica serovar Newport]ECA9031917.1 hypothetical protein [Salmonella enterica subsp. enterica serovar Newport]ECP4590558.1 hypothetical protein [Salmonella enterica subsp. enterica serovar Newport]
MAKDIAFKLGAVLNDEEAEIFADGYNAAMLQGGQPVSQTYGLPQTQFEQVADLYALCWQSGEVVTYTPDPEKATIWINNYSGTCVQEYVKLERLQEALAGNSPVIPDGYVLVPKKLTAENGAKSVLSGEFSETKFINCPECFGDDDCETCDGSGRIEITVPVTWTTIKAIWAKGVEHFAAAPQQEVKSALEHGMQRYAGAMQKLAEGDE